MKYLLLSITHLLAFSVKQAERHNLDEIRITIPRAKIIINEINSALLKLQ